jgi:hypothetical protein
MLSPNENIILKNFAEQLKADIQRAIKTKKVTKYGAVNSSGRLHDSVEIKYTENGFQILANDYIEGLIHGVAPGKSTATTSEIAQWIHDKPITPRGGIPIDSLASLIVKAQQREGNMIWRTHKGANSGLLTEVLADNKFDNFVELIASAAVTNLTESIVQSFDLQLT